MKENIKVLEEFIEKYNTDEDLFCFINYSTIQAIENLIKEIKNFKWKENEQKNLLKYKTDRIDKQQKELEELKEKNKKLEEQLRKANEYIRNEIYIDDNPTICGDEEDTITELPISLYLYNEGLRELLELLEERN